MRAFGEVLEEQRAVIAQHVGFQRQQTVLAHQSCPQVGHGGGLERVLLVRSQGLVDVAGFPSQQRFLHVGVRVRPLHPAVRAAGLCPGPIGACRRGDAVRDTGKLPGSGPASLWVWEAEAGMQQHLFWFCFSLSSPFSASQLGILFSQPFPSCPINWAPGQYHTL